MKSSPVTTFLNKLLDDIRFFARNFFDVYYRTLKYEIKKFGITEEGIEYYVIVIYSPPAENLLERLGKSNKLYLIVPAVLDVYFFNKISYISGIYEDLRARFVNIDDITLVINKIIEAFFNRICYLNDLNIIEDLNFRDFFEKHKEFIDEEVFNNVQMFRIAQEIYENKRFFVYFFEHYDVSKTFFKNRGLTISDFNYLLEKIPDCTISNLEILVDCGRYTNLVETYNILIRDPVLDVSEMMNKMYQFLAFVISKLGLKFVYPMRMFIVRNQAEILKLYEKGLITNNLKKV